MVDYCSMPRFVNIFSNGVEIPFWQWLEFPGVLADAQHVQAFDSEWIHTSFFLGFNRKITVSIFPFIDNQDVTCQVFMRFEIELIVGPTLQGCQLFQSDYLALKKSELPSQIQFAAPCFPSTIEEIIGPIGWQFWHSECGVPDPGPLPPS